MQDITVVYARDLDLNLLRVFTVVAEEQSVTRAAGRLYLTQPAISAAMRRLTEFVGADLLVRQGRGIALTRRGEELLTAARAHLKPLLIAATALPVFDPKVSNGIARVGIVGGAEAVILPKLRPRLQTEAPHMRLVVVPVQYQTVAAQLMANRIDVAICVAVERPQSIVRQSLPSARGSQLGILHDPRFSKLPKKVTERDYFAREHVAVSYAGDLRDIMEDAFKKARSVRVSVPAFSYVADVVDGSALLATVPALLARHIARHKPHLRFTRLPFSLKAATLELLWSKTSDADAEASFVRDCIVNVMSALESEIGES
jgi:LysR family transcriptional regulator, mexEF-oprN operon transcriptional activator